MKKFRVDVFCGRKCKKRFFDYERDALEYGRMRSACGCIVFLLRYGSRGSYTVVSQIFY